MAARAADLEADGLVRQIALGQGDRDGAAHWPGLLRIEVPEDGVRLLLQQALQEGGVAARSGLEREFAVFAGFGKILIAIGVGSDEEEVRGGLAVELDGLQGVLDTVS